MIDITVPPDIYPVVGRKENIFSSSVYSNSRNCEGSNNASEYGVNALHRTILTVTIGVEMSVCGGVIHVTEDEGEVPDSASDKTPLNSQHSGD